jgi:hypothetical protein
MKKKVAYTILIQFKKNCWKLCLSNFVLIQNKTWDIVFIIIKLKSKY